MVYKIVNSKFRIFLETLLISLAILVIGFSIGYYVESFKAQNIMDYYNNFEIGALDLKLQNYYYQIMDTASCQKAIEQNFIFADELYSKGLLLEKYEEANQISGQMEIEKKKYVLLKTELWLNSLLIKNKCKNPFHTVVYFYSKNYDKAKEAEQLAVSDTLKTLKNKQGNKIILIPIEGDLNLESVNMLMNIYNITYMPSILVNEKVLLEGYKEANNISKYL